MKFNGKIKNEDQEKLEKKYNFSFTNNTIDIKGQDLCVSDGSHKIYMLRADDKRIFSVGRDLSNDYRFGFMCEGSLAFMISDPHAACVVIENEANEIKGMAFVWTDEDKDLFVVDDVDIFSMRESIENNYMNLAMAYLEEIPYKNVQAGNIFGYEYHKGSPIEQVGIPAKDGKYPIAERPTMGDKPIYISYRAFKHSPLVIKNDGHMTKYTVDRTNITVSNLDKEDDKEM